MYDFRSVPSQHIMHDHLSILLFKDNHYFRYSIATISDVPVSFTILLIFLLRLDTFALFIKAPQCSFNKIENAA